MNENGFARINDKDERTADARHVHEVYSPVGLWRMVYEPTDTFRLIADIDMQGALWVPVAFSGKLEGNGHRICNVRITDSFDACEGFFTKLGKRAKITDTVFENVTVIADAAAKYIGAICGKNAGTIENCTVINAVFRDGEGKMPFRRQIGIAAGLNCGTAELVGRTSAAFLNQTAAETGLCGKTAENASVSGLWQDRSNATEFAGETERNMRQKVVDKMFQMGTFRWKLDETMEYECSCRQPFCKHKYLAGRQYYGLPYTHRSGSVERMRSCFGKVDGKKAEKLLPFASHPMDPDNGDLKDFSAYIGNDCSGAVYWAWATVSADISFRWTWDMIPTEENCKKSGVVKLSTYPCKLGNVTLREKDNILTDEAGVDHPEWLYEAYSLMRKGDALVHRSTVKLFTEDGKAKVGLGGHTIMASADPVVIRNADGTIDPARSHILTNEQGSPMGREDTSWTLGGVWSFDQLAYRRSMKSKKGWQLYVPITTHALQSGRPDEAALYTNCVTGPASGIVSSNFRINSTTAVVLDEKGKVLASDTEFTGVAGFDQMGMEFEGEDETGRLKLDEKQPKDYICRTTYRSVDLKKHEKVLADLPTGEYFYRVEVLLANGETKTVCGRFSK